MIETPFLTAKEAAAYLRIAPSTLYRHTMNGEIRYYKPGGKKILFDKADLEEWVRKGDSMPIVSTITKRVK